MVIAKFPKDTFKLLQFNIFCENGTKERHNIKQYITYNQLSNGNIILPVYFALYFHRY